MKKSQGSNKAKKHFTYFRIKIALELIKEMYRIRRERQFKINLFDTTCYRLQFASPESTSPQLKPDPKSILEIEFQSGQE